MALVRPGPRSGLKRRDFKHGSTDKSMIFDYHLDCGDGGELVRCRARAFPFPGTVLPGCTTEPEPLLGYGAPSHAFAASDDLLRLQH